MLRQCDLYLIENVTTLQATTIYVKVFRISDEQESRRWPICSDVLPMLSESLKEGCETSGRPFILMHEGLQLERSDEDIGFTEVKTLDAFMEHVAETCTSHYT